MDPFFLVVVFRAVAVLLEAVLLEEEAACFLGAVEADFLVDAMLLGAVAVFAEGFLAAVDAVFFGAAGFFEVDVLADAEASAASESSGQPIKTMAAAATNNGMIR